MKVSITRIYTYIYTHNYHRQSFQTSCHGNINPRPPHNDVGADNVFDLL